MAISPVKLEEISIMIRGGAQGIGGASANLLALAGARILRFRIEGGGR